MDAMSDVSDESDVVIELKEGSEEDSAEEPSESPSENRLDSEEDTQVSNLSESESETTRPPHLNSSATPIH